MGIPERFPGPASAMEKTMLHEEILGKAGEFRRGELKAPESAAVRRHLEACADCRALVERWSDAPLPLGFNQRVMSRLPGLPARRAIFWRGLLAPLAGTAVAAFLILAAFWHPERSWVNSDKSFAWTDSGRGSANQNQSFRP